MPAIVRDGDCVTTKPAMAQFNVRIDSSLKQLGDKGFRSVGLTPSEVVRLVWQRAARSSNGPAEILDFIRSAEDGRESEKADTERRRRIELARRGPEIVEEFYSELGVSLSSQKASMGGDDQSRRDDEMRLASFEDECGHVFP